jgi:serine/threonine protein kinase
MNVPNGGERLSPEPHHLSTSRLEPSEHLPFDLTRFAVTESDEPTIIDGAPAAFCESLALPSLEDYEIVGEIARGGMGVVYKAWEQSMKRWVALKCLPLSLAGDSLYLRLLRQEAVMAGRLTEHATLPVYRILEIDGSTVLVMPYIDGCDLRKIISDRRAVRQSTVSPGDGVGMLGTVLTRESSEGETRTIHGAVADDTGQDLPSGDMHTWALLHDHDYLEKVFALFDRILDALVGLQRAGVLHRDVKPSNILVGKNGSTWLTDFGLSYFSNCSGDAVIAQGVGTPGYMSPEQWHGEAEINAQTDVFGMGVTLYHALTLELPYGKSKIFPETPSPLPPRRHQHLLPASVNPVALKAIECDRKRRYATAADLQEDWQRIRKGLLPRIAQVGRVHRFAHALSQSTSHLVAAFGTSSHPS